MLHGHPCLGVECPERLVHQQRARAHDQDTRNADALAHAAGKLRGQGVRERFKPDQLEHRPRLGLVGVARQPLHPGSEGDVVPHVEPGKQRSLLEHNTTVGAGLVDWRAVE